MKNTRGSEWCRWDLHIHTPGTKKEDSFAGATLYEKWDMFYSDIAKYVGDGSDPQKRICAIGITDYLSIDNYMKVCADKRLPKCIVLIIPNVEMRILPIAKVTPVNIHCLFSPDIADELEARFFSKLEKEGGFSAARSELRRLGRTMNPALGDEAAYVEGINQFVIPIEAISSVFKKDPEVREKTIIVVSNNDNDGASGITKHEEFVIGKKSQLDATQQRIYQLTDMIFSANPNDAKFFLGEKKEGISVAEVIEKCGSLKPCIHGCDAHTNAKLFNPDNDQYCWIKSEPTFEGLKQIIYEPKNRVFIGSSCPDSFREKCVSAITINDKTWFPDKTILFNQGLVSIIGPRGSGKTALLDLIAVGLNSYDNSTASFLKKAKEKVQPLLIDIAVDDNTITSAYDLDKNDKEHRAKYLSQQFVESLCSEDGSSEKLITEIERFVFDSIDNINRMGTTCFSELKSLMCEENEMKQVKEKKEIEKASHDVTQITDLKNNVLPSKRKEQEKLQIEFDDLKRRLPTLNEVTKKQWSQEFETISAKKTQLEGELRIKQAELKQLQTLYSELCEFNQQIIQKSADFKQKLVAMGLPESNLQDINLQYPQVLLDTISATLSSRRADFNQKFGNEKNIAQYTYLWYKNKLQEIDEKQKSFSEQEKFFFSASTRIQQISLQQQELASQIVEMDGLNIANAQTKRMNSYKELFYLLAEQKSTLASLYEPLIKKLSGNEQEQKLGFFVKPKIDVERWVREGENLIDLRSAREFADHKEFTRQVRETLGAAWESFDPVQIEATMTDFFITNASTMMKYLTKDHTPYDIAKWLFSTDHISVSYELTFEGVPINQLSPGTKGVLLLLLFLGVDTNDQRPLLIDQPEDNLDPESVFKVLVPYFLQAKKRRQIIMVTHNPNLVVGADSDQVIVAAANFVTPNELPQFKYISGGLENPEISSKVCSILEGGEKAFQKRRSQYRIK